MQGITAAAGRTPGQQGRCHINALASTRCRPTGPCCLYACGWPTWTVDAHPCVRARTLQNPLAVAQQQVRHEAAGVGLLAPDSEVRLQQLRAQGCTTRMAAPHANAGAPGATEASTHGADASQPKQQEAPHTWWHGTACAPPPAGGHNQSANRPGCPPPSSRPLQAPSHCPPTHAHTHRRSAPRAGPPGPRTPAPAVPPSASRAAASPGGALPALGSARWEARRRALAGSCSRPGLHIANKARHDGRVGSGCLHPKTQSAACPQRLPTTEQRFALRTAGLMLRCGGGTARALPKGGVNPDMTRHHAQPQAGPGTWPPARLRRARAASHR